MPQCPICQTENPKNQNFCTQCGYDLRPILELLDHYISPDFHNREEKIQQLLSNWWTKNKQLEEELKILRSQSDASKVEHTDRVMELNVATYTHQRISEQEQKLPYYVRSEINQREKNEDSFQILQILPGFGKTPITVLAVADGMGGHTHGEDASREALRKISMILYEKLSIERSLNSLEVEAQVDMVMLSKALTQALQQTNTYLLRLVQANKWGNAGSTIVICAIISDAAVVAFLGDSPMFHYQRKKGELKKVTQDHTVAGVLQRAGLITPAMARFHEGRSRLEFYIGCSQFPKEEPIENLVLEAGDILLLCSDGVSGSLTNEKITQILAKNGDNLKLTAQELIKTSQATGETDNQTLILWCHPGQFVADVSVVENTDNLLHVR